MLVEGLKYLGSKHCETASLKKVLDFQGLHLPEEMLLGSGGGVGFIHWYAKGIPSPFIGTRFGICCAFLETAHKRIGAGAKVIETRSLKKGLDELKTLLLKGEPVICYGDMAYLPYLTVPKTTHFGCHAFVVFGLD